MMFWYDHNMGWWGWAGMGIGMLLFWALLIAGIVALVAYIGGDRQVRPGAMTTSSPEQVLAARFARGEIDETEYRDRLAVLRDHARPSS
ncbi:SHOCT domain-containing protein [Mycobacterium sp. 050134]|uniref:SHOCT domain-containing protein n=1 Tax=Mycobacterium sp. 050134 TaxID=3096111 RepID=UPI002EDB3AF8